MKHGSSTMGIVLLFFVIPYFLHMSLPWGENVAGSFTSSGPCPPGTQSESGCVHCRVDITHTEAELKIIEHVQNWLDFAQIDAVEHADTQSHFLHAVCTYNPVMLILAFASVIWLLSRQYRADLRNTLATQHIIEPMIESRRLWLYPAVSQVSLPESGGMGCMGCCRAPQRNVFRSYFCRVLA